MDIAAMLAQLQQSSLAVTIRDSLYIFPLLEAAHVIGLAIVFGTIAVIDLRLLGLASTQRPAQRVMADVLKWTAAAFVLTAITGVLMFLANPVVYFNSGYFRIKVLLLVLAGVNAAAFELTARKTIHRWNESPSAPGVARAIAAVSLIVWIGVIFTGRMIGFTTTRTTLTAPAPEEVNFDDLFAPPK